VLEVQVFGVPDYRMGEEVATWILLKEGQLMTEEEVKSFCKGSVRLYTFTLFQFSLHLNYTNYSYYTRYR
jgi:fatty-acyl-CoA synthase